MTTTTNWTRMRKGEGGRASEAPERRGRCASGPSLGAVGLSCIYVKGGTERHPRRALARVVLVDTCGDVLKDSLCRPEGRVWDYCTEETGLSEKLLEEAPTTRQVGAELKTFVLGKLVGHSLGGVLKQLGLQVSWKNRIDLAQNPEIRDEHGGSLERAFMASGLPFDGSPVSLARCMLSFYLQRRNAWDTRGSEPKKCRSRPARSPTRTSTRS
ncbi:hypothetical protein GMRT_11015 [Giardia muris]|uniref:Uncharacterized protein n=1 Tax=Giardia muris TaxID=5742 RepID=A0A4Z1T0S1_GIAMU|nr:hypothetical protein GMRT_11015 [Giardia muris]|eukprot:TNJ29298.1 hypothetical protein GMRT_11015 [Giardia muris]